MTNSTWLISINIESEDPKASIEAIIKDVKNLDVERVIKSVDIIEDFSDDFDPWYGDDDDMLAGF
jgi:hypothetical protein